MYNGPMDPIKNGVGKLATVPKGYKEASKDVKGEPCMVYLPTFTLEIIQSCRKIYQSHGSCGIQHLISKLNCEQCGCRGSKKVPSGRTQTPVYGL